MPTENAFEIEERDSELENTAGIIFIADYQTNRARKKLAHKIHPPIPLAYHRKNETLHIFSNTTANAIGYFLKWKIQVLTI